VIEAETWRARAMERGQPAAEQLVEVGPAPAGPNELKHQKVRPLRDDLGHAQRLGLRQPVEPARLGREHAVGGLVVALDEHPAAIGQVRLVGVVDVAARNTLPGHHRAAQRRFHRGDDGIAYHAPRL
jgi:hypothetical protein